MLLSAFCFHAVPCAQPPCHCFDSPAKAGISRLVQRAERGEVCFGSA